ncbi:flocculation protein FLO11-like [Sinocyclocheilus rhinocerous]|uniref:flocculation protein FLO11-like n=1 Tax=Sinocyclocheilus rhinocerous TaxID=307959 RepID=UPI0007B8EDBB|nr:PREDICTED: flocculation protein FLO11-like [Sinocyclocheilus rhinocerous]
MPMLSEFTKSFLTTSPLLNATTNAVTLTSLSETQNTAPTAFVSQSTKTTVSLATTETTAPTIIFVTQETTMPLSTSATGASPITSVTPMTASGVKTSIPINSAATIASTQTTAAVASKMLFNSSSPVPSESQVMSAINTLLKSRESQLSESLKVVNVTYEKISETSYAVLVTFHVVNISMPEDPDLRGDTYQQVKDIINDALNTLLNEPGKIVFEPKSSNFTSSSNQIDGGMDYTFQDGDAIQPVSFLNELRLPTTTTVLPETTTGFTVTPSSLIPGSAVVTSKLVFNSSSPVPSEALVLSAINTLRNSRESQLSESVQVVNVTYESKCLV